MSEETKKAAADEAPEVIYSYTRAQALADGVLVDVSREGRAAGFKYPVAVSAAVHASLEELAEKTGMPLPLVRVLVLGTMAQRAKQTDGSRFEVPDWNGEPLVFDCGPGDDASPVLTLMRREDD